MGYVYFDSISRNPREGQTVDVPLEHIFADESTATSLLVEGIYISPASARLAGKILNTRQQVSWPWTVQETLAVDEIVVVIFDVSRWVEHSKPAMFGDASVSRRRDSIHEPGGASEIQLTGYSRAI